MAMLTPAMLLRAGVGLAALGVAGCLYLSLGLGLAVCPLCGYQRAFLMASFAVLAVGVAAFREHPRMVMAMATPLVYAGFATAAYHVYLVFSGVLECPPGLFGFANFPAQSLMLFFLLACATATGAWLPGAGELPRRTVLVGGAKLLGILIAVLSITGTPPIPERTTPYEPDSLTNCRPAYRDAK